MSRKQLVVLYYALMTPFCRLWRGDSVVVSICVDFKATSLVPGRKENTRKTRTVSKIETSYEGLGQSARQRYQVEGPWNRSRVSHPAITLTLPLLNGRSTTSLCGPSMISLVIFEVFKQAHTFLNEHVECMWLISFTPYVTITIRELHVNSFWI